MAHALSGLGDEGGVGRGLLGGSGGSGLGGRPLVMSRGSVELPSWCLCCPPSTTPSLGWGQDRPRRSCGRRAGEQGFSEPIGLPRARCGGEDPCEPAGGSSGDRSLDLLRELFELPELLGVDARLRGGVGVGDPAGVGRVFAVADFGPRRPFQDLFGFNASRAL